MLRNLVIGIFIILQFSCSEKGRNHSHLLIPQSGLNFLLKQRHTEEIKGNIENLQLSIGDITAGKVDVSLKDKKGYVYVQKVMRENDEVAFMYGNNTYNLRIHHLINHLIGEDYAEISIEVNTNPSDSDKESERINTLLQTIEKSEVVFIRNGTEHSAKDAARHLRKKWDYAKDKIKTYQQFVDEIASRSSSSGKPYYVRLKDGTQMDAKEWINTLKI